MNHILLLVNYDSEMVKWYFSKTLNRSWSWLRVHLQHWIWRTWIYGWMSRYRWVLFTNTCMCFNWWTSKGFKITGRVRGRVTWAGPWIPGSFQTSGKIVWIPLGRTYVHVYLAMRLMWRPLLPNWVCITSQWRHNDIILTSYQVYYWFIFRNL